MSRLFLLAAEADKIQDYLFRSSRLREVVGGSHLLTRFCREAPGAIAKHRSGMKYKPIIQDGGSFRISFANKEDAKWFGECLAEMFFRVTGCSMSVAEPVEYESGEFREATKNAQIALRQAKMSKRGRSAVSHMPYMAYCSSCGVEVAADYQSVTADGSANYICKYCLVKADERDCTGEDVLEEFRSSIRHILPEAADMELAVPDAESVGEMTYLGYVGYLVADGNRMGVLFSSCPSEESMQELSDAISTVLRNSLAEVGAAILAKDNSENAGRVLPLLPLIMGGDDCFALVPAKFAVDIGRRFSLAFDRNMQEVMQKIDWMGAKLIQPTISTAVVVCKANYPFSLAHNQGEELLAEAKSLARSISRKYPDTPCSTISFGLSQGSRLNKAANYKGYRPTAQPYCVGMKKECFAPDFLDVSVLFAAKKYLGDLPGGPRRRLYELYFNLELLVSAEEADPTQGMRKWLNEAEYIKTRLEKVAQKADSLVNALRLVPAGKVDMTDYPWWFYINRPYGTEFSGHYLPDLLEIWDFMESVDGVKSGEEA